MNNLKIVPIIFVSFFSMNLPAMDSISWDEKPFTFTETTKSWPYQNHRVLNIALDGKWLAELVYFVPHAQPVARKGKQVPEIPIIISNIKATRNKDGKCSDEAFHHMRMLIEYLLVRLSDRHEWSVRMSKEVQSVFRLMDLRSLVAQGIRVDLAEYIVFFAKTHEELRILVDNYNIGQQMDDLVKESLSKKTEKTEKVSQAVNKRVSELKKPLIEK